MSFPRRSRTGVAPARLAVSMFTRWPYVLAIALAIAPREASAEKITLDAAVQRARSANPNIAVAEADRLSGEGRVEAAGVSPFNPELNLGAGRASGGGTFFDWQIGLTQTLELGGKRSKRVAAAGARRDALVVHVAQQQWIVTVEAGRAFRAAVIARERAAATAEAARLADEVDAAVRARQAAGGGTQLEVNVALANRGRARRDALEAARTYTAARVALDQAVAAPAGTLLEPDGSLPGFPAPPWTEDQVTATALRSRTDIAIAERERLAAKADVDVADVGAVPDVALGVSFARNEETDVFLGSVTIPIPILNRNQGERRVARSELRKAEIVQRATVTAVEREARAAYRSYVTARAAVETFDRDVVGKLDENLALAGRSFTSGKISLVEVNVLRRELIDARTAYLDALAEAVDARAALELATGAGLE